MAFYRLVSLKNNPNKFIVSVVFALSLFIYGISNPEFNWDIIGYVAAAHYQDGLTGDSLRSTTYSEIQSITNASYFKELTDISYYRKTIYENSDALVQQMPFYTIRMAYLWTMKTTSALFGIPMAKATYLISSFFAGLCIILLFLLFNPENFWLILAFPLVMIFSGFPEVATLSTPDTMAGFFALLAIFFFQKERYLQTLITLTILPFVRTDFIVLAGLIAMCSFYKNKNLRSLLLAALPLFAYFFINKINANYGYLKIFNFTLIGNTPFPATMDIKTDFAPYLKAYISGFSALIDHKHFVLYISYLLFWWKFIRPKKITTFNEQVFIVLGFVSLHMILFPAYFQRFFSWCAAIAGLQMIQWIFEMKRLKKT